MSECQVRGCTNQGTIVFTVPDLQRTVQYLVCEVHDLELKASPYMAIGPAASELLVGCDAPPHIVDFILAQSIGNALVVTLKLGRDGLVEQEVELMMTREDHQQLGMFFR